MAPRLADFSARFAAIEREIITDTPTWYASFENQGEYPLRKSGAAGGTCVWTTGNRVLSAQNTISMEIWFWLDSVGGGNLFDNGRGGANGYSISLDGSAKIVATAQGVAILTTGTNACTAKAWNQVVVKKAATSGGIWTYYLNGAVDLANAGTANPVAPSADVRTVIGPGNETGKPRIYVAMAATYTSALSDARVLAHWNAI